MTWTPRRRPLVSVVPGSRIGRVVPATGGIRRCVGGAQRSRRCRARRAERWDCRTVRSSASDTTPWRRAALRRYWSRRLHNSPPSPPGRLVSTRITPTPTTRNDQGAGSSHCAPCVNSAPIGPPDSAPNPPIDGRHEDVDALVGGVADVAERGLVVDEEHAGDRRDPPGHRERRELGPGRVHAERHDVRLVVAQRDQHPAGPAPADAADDPRHHDERRRARSSRAASG